MSVSCTAWLADGAYKGDGHFLNNLQKKAGIGVLGMVNDQSKTVWRVNHTATESPRFE